MVHAEKSYGQSGLFKSRIKENLRWAVTAAKWASNRVHRDPNHSREVWNSNLSTEVGFWERWIATRGLSWPDDFERRTSLSAEIGPQIAQFVESYKDKLLDVGAGPLTVIGTMWKGHKMDVSAVDPLADSYNALLDRYQIVPPVRTQNIAAEELSLSFAPETFDLCFARNCLDHSYNPGLAIEQMLLVTKRGRKVVLVHQLNEGSNELYRGLHQWNFTQRDGEFLISAPGRDTTNVSRKLGKAANVSVTSEHGWLTAVIRKE